MHGESASLPKTQLRLGTITLLGRKQKYEAKYLEIYDHLRRGSEGALSGSRPTRWLRVHILSRHHSIPIFHKSAPQRRSRIGRYRMRCDNPDMDYFGYPDYTRRFAS